LYWRLRHENGAQGDFSLTQALIINQERAAKDQPYANAHPPIFPCALAGSQPNIYSQTLAGKRTPGK